MCIIWASSATQISLRPGLRFSRAPPSAPSTPAPPPPPSAPSTPAPPPPPRRPRPSAAAPHACRCSRRHAAAPRSLALAQPRVDDAEKTSRSSPAGAMRNSGFSLVLLTFVWNLSPGIVRAEVSSCPDPILSVQAVKRYMHAYTHTLGYKCVSGCVCVQT